MKDKLTLKSLKQELENMKLKSTSNSKVNKTIPTNAKAGVVGHDIKNSYVNRLYMKSGALWLYIITGVLSYGHKIPYIGRIISLIAAVYARTTIIKVLSKVRKIFIVFNALIGVYLVFKSVGFSTDNLIVGFIAVGETYFQTLLGFTSKLFHWFIELFDHKIVPNIPGDNGGTWFSKPKLSEGTNASKYKSFIIPSPDNIIDTVSGKGFSLRELYMPSHTKFVENKSWFSYITDSNTWWWIAVTAGTIGVVYLGYHLCINPDFTKDLLYPKPKTNIHPPTPPINPAGEDITLTGAVADFFNSSRRKIINIYSSTVNILNPFNYFVTSTELQSQFNLFMDIQNDMNRANRKLYPFTEYNPLDPWYKKLRLHIFGESGKEFIDRSQLINKADAVYNALKIDKGKAIEFSSTIFSTNNSAWNSPQVLSPIATTIGLNPGALDAFNNAAAVITEQKLSSIPNSPLSGLTKLWSEPPLEDTLEHLEKRLRAVKNPLPSTSDNATIIELDSPTTPTPQNNASGMGVLEI